MADRRPTAIAPAPPATPRRRSGSCAPSAGCCNSTREKPAPQIRQSASAPPAAPAASAAGIRAAASRSAPAAPNAAPTRNTAGTLPPYLLPQERLFSQRISRNRKTLINTIANTAPGAGMMNAIAATMTPQPQVQRVAHVAVWSDPPRSRQLSSPCCSDARAQVCGAPHAQARASAASAALHTITTGPPP